MMRSQPNNRAKMPLLAGAAGLAAIAAMATGFTSAAAAVITPCSVVYVASHADLTSG